METETRTRSRTQKHSLRRKLTLIVTLIAAVILIVNLFFFFNTTRMIREIGSVYDNNILLNDLTDTISLFQESLTNYLNTKSTDSMEDYYRYEQDIDNMLESLNNEVSADPALLMERNIRNLTESYMELTDSAVEAKRGRNLQKYKEYYDQATEIHDYVNTYISGLNSIRFTENGESYELLSATLGRMEAVSIAIFVVTAGVGLLMVSLISNTVTIPLRNLAVAAEQVSKGDYDVKLENESGGDEVGVLTDAFSTMAVGIQKNIVQLRENMEKEQQMKERELMMEAHLKDARLKYLQAQINPHFLFNTLNAGAQLAMMEGADRAYEYIQQVAEFYRYNIQKDQDTVSLGDEITLVDTYIYILNVRFSGEIGYEKKIEDERFLQTRVPGMILQPIVENSVKYGIRGIDRDGMITLSVFREDGYICVSVQDNGAGMTQERICEVMERHAAAAEQTGDSNGIGLDNVMNRLELMYGKNARLEMISEGKNKGTEVILFIPEVEENV